MATIITTTQSYITPAEFLLRFDARAIARYCADDENAVPPADLPTNEVLLWALKSASGMVQASAVRGCRYTPQQLEELINQVPLTLSGETLKDVTAWLAITKLQERRPHGGEPPNEYHYERAMGFLERLAAGDQVLAFEETVDAGLIDLGETDYEDLQETCATVFRANRLLGDHARESRKC